MPISLFGLDSRFRMVQQQARARWGAEVFRLMSRMNSPTSSAAPPLWRPHLFGGKEGRSALVGAAKRAGGSAPARPRSAISTLPKAGGMRRMRRRRPRLRRRPRRQRRPRQRRKWWRMHRLRSRRRRQRRECNFYAAKCIGFVDDDVSIRDFSSNAKPILGW